MNKNSMIIIFAFLISMLVTQHSYAMPSFARQTGLPCSSCHVQSFGPNLTPIGRNFKLNGYTTTGNSDSKLKYIPPISAMIRGSFTNTIKDQPDGAADGYGRNNNATLDEASVFYAGRIAPKMGAFIQGTYSGVEKNGSLITLIFASRIGAILAVISWSMALRRITHPLSRISGIPRRYGVFHTHPRIWHPLRPQDR